MCWWQGRRSKQGCLPALLLCAHLFCCCCCYGLASQHGLETSPSTPGLHSHTGLQSIQPHGLSRSPFLSLSNVQMAVVALGRPNTSPSIKISLLLVLYLWRAPTDTEIQQVVLVPEGWGGPIHLPCRLVQANSFQSKATQVAAMVPETQGRKRKDKRAWENLFMNQI